MPYQEVFKKLGVEVVHDLRLATLHFKDELLHINTYGIYEFNTREVCLHRGPSQISGILFYVDEGHIVPVGFRATNKDSFLSTKHDDVRHWTAWNPIQPSRMQNEMKLDTAETEEIAKAYCHYYKVDYGSLPEKDKANGARIFLERVFDAYAEKVSVLNENVKADPQVREKYINSVLRATKYALRNAHSKKVKW